MATAQQPTGGQGQGSGLGQQRDPETDITASTTPMPSIAHLPPSVRKPPSALDLFRYRAYRAGQSIEDLATADKVSIFAIEASLLRVRIDNQRFSPEAVGIASRRVMIDNANGINQAIKKALRATKLRTRQVIKTDPMTGELRTLDESEEYPDHDTRLKAVDSARSTVSVVQPRDAAVVVNANSSTHTQNNTLVQGGGGVGAGGQAGLTSPEAVIRLVQAQRAKLALSTPDSTTANSTVEGTVIVPNGDSGECSNEGVDEGAEEVSDDYLDEDETGDEDAEDE